MEIESSAPNESELAVDAAADGLAEVGRCRSCGVLESLTDGLCPSCRERSVRAAQQLQAAAVRFDAEEGTDAGSSEVATRRWPLAVAAAVTLAVAGIPIQRGLWGGFAESVDPAASSTSTAVALTPPPTGQTLSGVGVEAGAWSSKAWRDPEADGAVAFREGRLDDALSRFESAVKERPDDTEALNNLGQTLVGLGRAAEAVPHLERAARFAPHDWMIHFNWGRALGEVGRWTDAVTAYERADTITPGSYETLFNLARALRVAGKPDRAVETYQRAVRLDEANPAGYLGLATALEGLDRRPEALAAFERYLELAPLGTAEATRVRKHVTAVRIASSSASLR